MSTAFLVSLFEGVVRASVLGSIAVVLVLVLRRSLRGRLSPGIRCLLWLPVCVLLVLPQLPDLGFGTGHEALSTRLLPAAKPEAKQTQVVVRTDSPTLLSASEKPPAATAPSLSLMECLPLIWASGCGVLALVWLTSFLLLRRRSMNTTGPVPEEVAELFVQCVKTMGLRRVPQVRVTCAVNSPALMGMLSPVMLLPPSLPGVLTTEELRMVMLHEAGHVKRHDLLLHWVSLALLALHWFNPLCWLAAWLFRADRESACDAAVLKACRQDCRSVYGHTLLKLQAGLAGIARLRPLVGILGSTDMLRQRIVEIARFGRGSKGAGMVSFAAVMLASACIAIMAAEPAQPPAVAKVEAAVEKAAPIIRIYKVRRDFLSRMPGSPAKPVAAKDPFAPGSESTKGGQVRLSAKDLLLACGVPFPDGSTAVFNPVTSQLIVRNTEENLRFVTAYVDEANKTHPLIFVTARMVVFDEKETGKAAWMPPDPTGREQALPSAPDSLPRLQLCGTYSDPQYQVLMRAFQKKVTSLEGDAADAFVKRMREMSGYVKAVLQLPSVTFAQDAKATMEVVREVLYATEYDAQGKPETFEMKAAGVKMELEAVGSDDGKIIELTSAPEIVGLMEWKHYGKKGGPDISQPVFSTNRASISVAIRDGSTVAFGGDMPVCNFLLDPKTQGEAAPMAKVCPVLLFVTARLIDPSGQPFKPQSSNTGAGASQARPATMPTAGASAIVTRTFKVPAKLFAALGDIGPAGGVPQPAGASTTYDVKNSSLIVINTPANQGIVEALIETKTRELQQEAQRVKLTMTACEMTYDKASKRGVDWLTWPTSKLQDPSSPPLVVPAGSVSLAEMPNFSPPLLALAGILTADQYAKVMRDASRQLGVKTGKKTTQTLKRPDDKALFDMGELMRHRKIEVAAVIGPDGYTVDLAIKTDDKARAVKTAVTVWPKQTVLMGGLIFEDEKSRHSLMMFITAEIVPGP